MVAFTSAATAGSAGPDSRHADPPHALSPSAPEPNAALATADPTGLVAAMLAISQVMGTSHELREVLPTILDLALHAVHAQQGSILMFDRHCDQLQMLAAIGLPEEIVRKGYIPRAGSIAEWVIEHDQPIIINDKPKTNQYRAMDDKRRIVSAMCVPLRAQGTVLGTININRTDAAYGTFIQQDLDTMVILASQAAICIENSRLHAATLKTERLAAIGQTVAGISHCIKNVMTGVRGGMSLVEMGAGARDWTLLDQGKDILRRNVERLSSIVMDMLDYSKDRVPVKGTVGLYGLAEEIQGTVHSAAEAKQINFELRLTREAGMVEADGTQLFRCVLNLAQNAIDATPDGGTVWISAERRTDKAALHRLHAPAHPADDLVTTEASAEPSPPPTAAVVIHVGDTGEGIDEEHRAVIFEPFFSTKGSKGTGLGLAVTRKIIEEHGGTIEVASKPEEGSVFSIYLPA